MYFNLSFRLLSPPTFSTSSIPSFYPTLFLQFSSPTSSSSLQPIISSSSLPDTILSHRHYVQVLKDVQRPPKRKIRFLGRKKRRPRGLLQLTLSDGASIRERQRDSFLCHEGLTIPELDFAGEFDEVERFPKKCSNVLCEVTVPIPSDQRTRSNPKKSFSIVFLFELRMIRLRKDEIPTTLPFLFDDLRCLISLNRFVSLFESESAFEPPVDAVRFLLSDWEDGASPVHVVLVSIGEGLGFAMNALRARQIEARKSSEEGLSKVEDARILDAEELFRLVMEIMSASKVLSNEISTRDRGDDEPVVPATSSSLGGESSPNEPRQENDDSDSDSHSDPDSDSHTDSDSDSHSYSDSDSHSDSEKGGEESSLPPPEDDSGDDDERRPKNIGKKVRHLFKKLKTFRKANEEEDGEEIPNDIFDEMPLPQVRGSFLSHRVLDPDNEI